MTDTKQPLNPFIEKLSYITRAYELCSAEPCAQYGLSQTELDITAFLANNPGTDTAGDITMYRYISKASVSLAVESLIQKKLLTRTEDTEDRRRVHLSLTKEALEMMPAINNSRKKLQDILFAGFTPSQKEKLLTGISQSAENAHTFISRKNPEVKNEY